VHPVTNRGLNGRLIVGRESVGKRENKQSESESNGTSEVHNWQSM
jgi:hypothetical protein